MTNIMFSFCSLKPCCHLFFGGHWITIIFGGQPPHLAQPPIFVRLQSPSQCVVAWAPPEISHTSHEQTILLLHIVPTTFNSTSPTPSSFNTADHNSVVQFFDNSLYFCASSSEYWCSSSCWAFCRGHGSSGPRRIKGNFMEIGFIHSSPLCATVVLQSKRAR